MQARALHDSDREPVRIWEINGHLCCVAHRKEFDDYIGSVNYSEDSWVIIIPTDLLEKAVKDVQWFANNPIQN